MRGLPIWMLGLLANPVEMPLTIIPGLVVGLVLLLLARPLSVLVCALLSGWVP